MRETIELSIEQFEDLYSEWGDYQIVINEDDSISIHDRNGEEIAYDIEEANEILTDYRYVLKKNKLMISSLSDKNAKIEHYTYSFEVQYESLADKIEDVIGVKITNLHIETNDDDEPEVTFEFTSNMTSGEKRKINRDIQNIVDQYILNNSN